jgi:hypothetical protein
MLGTATEGAQYQQQCRVLRRLQLFPSQDQLCRFALLHRTVHRIGLTECRFLRTGDATRQTAAIQNVHESVHTESIAPMLVGHREMYEGSTAMTQIPPVRAPWRQPVAELRGGTPRQADRRAQYWPAETTVLPRANIVAKQPVRGLDPECQDSAAQMSNCRPLFTTVLTSVPVASKVKVTVPL